MMASLTWAPRLPASCLRSWSVRDLVLARPYVRAAETAVVACFSLLAGVQGLGSRGLGALCAISIAAKRLGPPLSWAQRWYLPGRLAPAPAPCGASPTNALLQLHR